MRGGRGKSTVDTGVGGNGRHFPAQHDPNADRAFRGSPFRNRIPDRWVCCINRLDEAEQARMSGIDFERIACIVSVEAEWRDQQRAVDAYVIHRTYHLVA